MSDISSEIDQGYEPESIELQSNQNGVIVPTDELTWRAMMLEEQCHNIIDSLESGSKYRASEGDIIGIPDYKKDTLRTAWDTRLGSHPTALHIFAKILQKKTSRCNETFKDLISDLLDNMDNIKVDEGGKVKQDLILVVAINFENDFFIDLVEECHPAAFRNLMERQDRDKKNVFHHLLDYNTPFGKDNAKVKGHRMRVHKLIHMAQPKDLVAKDKDGNTPVHLAVHYQQCYKRQGNYIKMVEYMVTETRDIMGLDETLNEKGESPLVFLTNTQKRFKSDKAAHVQSRMPAQESSSKKTPSSSRDKEGRESSNKKERPEISVSILSRRPSTAIQVEQRSTAKEAKKDTPQVLPDGKGINRFKSGRSGGSSGNGKVDTPLEISKFLRMHYLRTFSDLEARQLIYGTGNNCCKSLFFDASGHESSDSIKTLLTRIKPGGFSDILSYVYLPSVAQTVGKYRSTGEISREESKENSNVGRTSLIPVFDKLRDLNVKRILRLSVDDLDNPSHTDAAIERSIRGMEDLHLPVERESSTWIEIESWDWKKADLSIDVIEFVAPNVEHLNLYWSGNRAVLRGWSSQKGIPRLSRNKLKKVTIFASPGIETYERMKAALELFKNELNQDGAASKVEIKIVERINGLQDKASTERKFPTANSGSSDQYQHKWIETMEDFRGALFKIEDRFMPSKDKKIKVAVIDDGVDLSSIETYHDRVGWEGQSFASAVGGQERSWYGSSHGHGTVMANSISRINPWVNLLLLRVQDSETQIGQRTISADSAARAVDFAVQSGADIISMSWTIINRTKDTGITEAEKAVGRSTAIQRLKNALNNAQEKKILLFCSASDNIQASADESLPYQAVRDYVFRIGAALSLGQADAQTEDHERISYFFPGHQVADSRNPRSSAPIINRDGSSVSTALAAGLASLIMWCAMIVEDRREKEGGHIGLKLDPAKLKERANLKRAFDNIEKDSWQNKKYLPVWGLFSETTRAISEEKDSSKLVVCLRNELVAKLYSKVI